MGKERLMFLMITMICCGIGGVSVSAAVYKVGESSGWSMGPDYSNWAADKTLKVGDTLEFNYASGHSVDEVSEDDYKSCSTGNAIMSDSSGATSVVLKTAGSHYYICGIPGHCSSGMKLAVTVAAAAPTDGSKTSPSGTTTTTSPPSPTTTTISPPSPTTTATPVPPTVLTSPTGTTEHPSSSSSSSVFSPVAAEFLVVVFAALNLVLL